jgi:hypothetical protein
MPTVIYGLISLHTALLTVSSIGKINKSNSLLLIVQYPPPCRPLDISTDLPCYTVLLQIRTSLCHSFLKVQHLTFIFGKIVSIKRDLTQFFLIFVEVSRCRSLERRSVEQTHCGQFKNTDKVIHYRFFSRICQKNMSVFIKVQSFNCIL